MSEMNQYAWWIYKGTGMPHGSIKGLPKPPNWRKFDGEVIAGPKRLATIKDADIQRHIGSKPSRNVRLDPVEDKELIKEIEMVNAALFLRRPLLVIGKPGCGKSSLAYAVAYELQLGPVLRWPITTHSTLADGLYRYDAIGRLQDASYKRSLSPDVPLKESATNIGKYLRLGPLGTALLPVEYPRVLLIDEIDKSDIDLPNDLLNIFEEGYFDIPELKRMAEEEQKEQKDKPVKVMPDDGEDDNDRVPITNGHVQCHVFPFVVLTSNGERDFPPAFKRRCLQLEMQLPNPKRLSEIVEAHLGEDVLKEDQTQQLIKDFLSLRDKGKGALATDQLLNAIYMTSSGDLKQGKVETITLQTVSGKMERPWSIEGGFAVVYKFRTQSGKMRALRCFRVSMPPDIHFRYEQIGSYFAAHIPDITVAFTYHANSIALKENVQGHLQSRIYPLLEMDWIEGVTLLEYVNELCQKRDRAGLADLHKKFVALVQAMRQAKIAHGDLSGIDIMVRADGGLVLVDYDGVYIPAFVGLPQIVLGQVDYQHPQMIQRKFNEQMDNFSILVIQTALLALQTQTELWDQYTDHNTQGDVPQIP